MWGSRLSNNLLYTEIISLSNIRHMKFQTWYMHV